MSTPSYPFPNRSARELTAHRVNGLNEALRIFVLDQPGHGNACHVYVTLIPIGPKQAAITHPELINWEAGISGTFQGSDKTHILVISEDNTRAMITKQDTSLEPEYFTIQWTNFQNGPIKEHGVNGTSQEALIAILIDRLEGFQVGDFKCHDNQVALDALQTARLWLHKRTMDRVARNVEGTHAK